MAELLLEVIHCMQREGGGGEKWGGKKLSIAPIHYVAIECIWRRCQPANERSFVDLPNYSRIFFHRHFSPLFCLVLYDVCSAFCVLPIPHVDKKLKYLL